MSMSPDAHEGMLLDSPDERRRRRRRQVCLVLLFLSPAIVLVGTVFSSAVREWASREPFDSDRWKASLVEEPPGFIRLRMVDDLLKRQQLVGKTQAEIVELLGETPYYKYFALYEWAYYLGPARGSFSLGREWLGFHFEEDRVAEVRLLQR